MEGDARPRPEPVVRPAKVRTVYSPGIPEEDVRLLRDNPGKLVPASRPVPPKKAALRTDPWSQLGLLLFLQLLTALPVVVFLVGYASTETSDLGWLVAAYCGVNALAGLLMLAGSAGEGGDRRAARIHHGRYLCAADFDEPAAALLRRAQAAIEGIAASQAAEEGIIGGTPLLRRYEWDLARLLYRQSRARGTADPDDPGLEQSVASATRRVEHLEEYHRRVAALSSVYRAKDHLDDLAEAIDLLPRREDTAALETLAWHAEQVESMVRADLRAAARRDPDDDRA